MNTLKKYLPVVSLWLLLACSSSDDAPAPNTTCIRIGANCKDGTTSTATGSGACSGHGGVSSWICQ